MVNSAAAKASKRKLMLRKKSLVLADVETKQHRKGLLVYWLTLLTLVVINMLAAVVIAVIQLATSSQQVLLIVGVLGSFFGYVSHRLVKLVMEGRRHVFATLVVPTAAVVNLLIVSSAANKISSAIGLGHFHNPILVSLSYGVGFIMPALVFGGIRNFGKGKA